MDKDLDDKVITDEVDCKPSNVKLELNPDSNPPNTVSDKHDDVVEEKKEDEEEDEEEEEEEEDRIIEKSPNLRFHKRNKKYMRKVPGIDNSFIAIEPKSGKEVIWNEINLSDKKVEQENRFINLIKKLKRYNHPFFVRFLEVWQSKQETGCRKIIFITERLTDPTMKQYFVNSSSIHRLTNKVLWRKFVGQLISVLKFLNHLGVNHGNLSNETVYYQNTGCLKVGTLSVDLNFDNKPSSDICDMGKLALEMAAYDALDDLENLPIKDRTNKMLARVHDSAQCNFIEMCLDHSESPTTLSKLFQHIVLKEVPSLKRLAAKIIVQNSISTNEDDKVESQYSTFSNIFKDQVSHFEDETVLFKVIFIHDNITKLRLWKEFRINFLNLPKYIEDVRNGFYPIFEAKSGQVPEEADEITYSYSVDLEPSKDAGLVNMHSKDSCLSQCLENLDSAKECLPPVTIIDKGTLKDMGNDAKVDEVIEARNKTDSSLTIQGVTDAKSALVGTTNDKSGLLPHPKDSIIPHDVKTDIPEAHRRASAEDSKLEAAVDALSSLHPDVQTDSAVPFEDNVENELDEDDEDEEDEGFNNGGPDRLEPYWDYVSPPDKPPSDRALFTGCLYSYIGCGRWQIYVQIWFLEDRLKREVIIQVMEHEWNNDSRVASMFENGKIISSADKPVLERILGYARHNCPLMDGELIPPQKKLANFDAYDLYQRLEHLQMFTKARQLLEKAEAERGQLGKTTISPIELSSVVSPSARAPNQTSQNSLATPREPLISHPSLEESNRDIKISPLSDSANMDDKAAILKGIKIGELPGFKMELMDIRVLAPLNYRCMFCDNHDYLHSEELPPYLSSPCYHCREGLAKEAKISPANLFDLHQQNFIPWPAFLQVRFNIPPVAYPNSQDAPADCKTLRELIDYDCKWRDRIPCHCYPGVELPPCVEFPNIYVDDLTDMSNMTYAINEHFMDHKSPIVGDGHTSSATIGTIGGGTAEINHELAMRQNSLPLNMKQNPIFPCTNRHIKGATITCVHGITFPRIPYSSSAQLPFFKKHVR